MLRKFAVTKCTEPLSEKRYFYFYFTDLFIQTPQSLRKDFLSHTGHYFFDNNMAVFSHFYSNVTCRFPKELYRVLPFFCVLMALQQNKTEIRCLNFFFSFQFSNFIAMIRYDVI